MREFALVLAVFIGMVLPAAAQPVFDDPRSLVEYAYQPYLDGVFPEDPYELYSPTLLELWEAMQERSADDEIGGIDFDPFINAQDYDIDELSISDAQVEGDSAVVVASFTNFGEPQEIRFTLVRRVEGWKIDDMESALGEFPWRLSELLAADPLLN